MSAWRSGVLAVLVAAGLAVVVAARSAAWAPAPTRTAAVATSRLLVYAQEWSLWLSRSTLPAGNVIVQLWNRGQDAHDVRIRRLNSRGAMVGRYQGIGVTQSGQIRQAVWPLGPGRYELYCSMPGHMKRGMHARLTVR
jgi:Sulfocyanin (SoxE) domain